MVKYLGICGTSVCAGESLRCAVRTTSLYTAYYLGSCVPCALRFIPLADLFRISLTALFLLGVQTTWPGFAQAEALRDPTMPPARPGLVQADAMPVEKPKPVLQSVALGTTHKSAMISGQTVLLGQQFEGLTLVKLTATEAVLQDENGHLEVLKMEYPIQKNTRSAVAQPDIKAKRHAVLHVANENK